MELRVDGAKADGMSLEKETGGESKRKGGRVYKRCDRLEEERRQNVEGMGSDVERQRWNGRGAESRGNGGRVEEKS